MNVVGEYVHVVHRRLVPDELRRHFVGQVEQATDNALLVEGVGFYLSGANNLFVKNPDIIRRIIGITDGHSHITVLGPELNLEQLRYEVRDGQLQMTDGSGFVLDINEFGARR